MKKAYHTTITHKPHVDVWALFAEVCDEAERDTTAGYEAFGQMADDAFNTSVNDAFGALRIQYGGSNV